MICPLVVLRPEPGSSETVAMASKLGLAPIASPVFRIEPVAWAAPDPRAFDGLLFGSANAVRHGGERLASLRDLPVYAVGPRTAEAARAAGFRIAAAGAGGLQSLFETLAGPLRLMRLGGEEQVALTLPTGITMETHTVYRASPLPLSPDAAAALREGAVVLLHSSAAARRLAAECRRLAIDRGAIAVAALAPAVAEAAGAGWVRVEVAPAVSDLALLAMAADMCQNPGPGAGQAKIET